MGLELVEIIMDWERSFGISLPDAVMEHTLTPREIVNYLVVALAADDQRGGPCLTLRAFGRLRAALIREAGAPRARVRPAARLDDLLPENDRAQVWESVRQSSDIPSLPSWRHGIFLAFKSRTISDLVSTVALHHASELKPAGEPWTRAQIHSVVRGVVAQHLVRPDFSDDDEFLSDLKLD